MSEESVGDTDSVAADEPSNAFPDPPPNTSVVPSPWNLSMVKVFSPAAVDILFHVAPIYAWKVDVVVLKIT